MREILFRGKRKDNGEWIYGVPITDESTNDAYIITSTAGASLKSGINNMCATGFRIIRNTIGQYTGLTDKNDTRIFEGDVIKHEGENFIVYWNEECAGFYPFYDQDNPIGYGVIGEESEVIGNVHDNPELLEGYGIKER